MPQWHRAKVNGYFSRASTIEGHPGRKYFIKEIPGDGWYLLDGYSNDGPKYGPFPNLRVAKTAWVLMFGS